MINQWLCLSDFALTIAEISDPISIPVDDYLNERNSDCLDFLLL